MSLVLDCIILGILIAGFVKGIIKGMTQQAFSLGGLILGIVLGTLLYQPFAGFLENTLNMPERPACILAFVIILIIVPVFCGFIGKLLSRIIHAASLGLLDRLLGACFGFFISMLVMGLIIMLLDFTGISDSIIRKDDKRQSVLYRPVGDFSRFCLQWTWNKVKDDAEKLVPDLNRKNQKETNKSDQKKV